MIKKRSKFWTVAFAFIPGAGHMFNGFMKMGLSLMTTFFVLFFMAIVMNLGALAVLTPVVWFYAFFDCINKRFQDDEEFYTQEDEYLFSLDTILNFDFGIQDRKRQIWGVALLIVGLYILWNNVIWGVLRRSDILPTVLWNFINSFNYMLPQVIVCLLIIYFGLVLIRGKKEELEEYDADKRSRNQEPGPGYYNPYEGGFRRSEVTFAPVTDEKNITNPIGEPLNGERNTNPNGDPENRKSDINSAEPESAAQEENNITEIIYGVRTLEGETSVSGSEAAPTGLQEGSKEAEEK